MKNFIEFILKLNTKNSENNSNKLKASVSGLCKSITNLRNLLFAGYAGSLLGRTLKELVTTSNDFKMALQGVKQTAKAFGQDTDEATAAAKKLSEDGLLNLRQSAEGLKFLMSSGFNIKESLKIGEAFKDIGAFNNVVGDLGQAFIDSARGIKTGSVELIENIGFTQRLSTVMKNANISIKDGIDISNNLAQRRALLNAVVNEGMKFQGNANKLANDSVGIQKKVANQYEMIKAKLGDIVTIAISPFISQLSQDLLGLDASIESNSGSLQQLGKEIGELISKAYTFAKTVIQIITENKDLVINLGYTIIAIKTLSVLIPVLTGGIGLLKEAMLALQLKSGPIPLILTAIAAAIGIVVTSIMKEKFALNELAALQGKYSDIQKLSFQNLKNEHYWNNKKAEDLENLIKRYKDLKKESVDNSDKQKELKTVLSEDKENYPELIKYTGKYGDEMELNVGKAESYLNAQKQLTILKLKEKLTELNESIKKNDEQIRYWRRPTALEKGGQLVSGIYTALKTGKDNTMVGYRQDTVKPYEETNETLTQYAEKLNAYIEELKKPISATPATEGKENPLTNGQMSVTAKRPYPLETANYDLQRKSTNTEYDYATNPEYKDKYKVTAKDKFDLFKSYQGDVFNYDLDKYVSPDASSEERQGIYEKLEKDILAYKEQYIKLYQDVLAEQKESKDKELEYSEYINERLINDEKYKFEKQRNDAKTNHENMINEHKNNSERIIEINAAYNKELEKIKNDEIEFKKQKDDYYKQFSYDTLMKMLDDETLAASEKERIVSDMNERIKGKQVSLNEAFDFGWRQAASNFKTTTEVMQEAGAELANTLNDGLSSFLQSTISNIGNAKEAWLNFADLIKKAYIKAIADMIVAETKLTGAKSLIKTGLGFLGSLFGLGKGGDISGSLGGGKAGFTTAPMLFASGGWIDGPGTETSDSIPARLSNNEFVVNARSAKRYGRLLEQINNNKFAKGGWVGGDASEDTDLEPNSKQQPIVIINLTDPADIVRAGLQENYKPIYNRISGDMVKDKRVKAEISK